MNIEKIDHICIAVKDLKKSEEYMKDIFGLTPDDKYVEESEKINVARYYIGEVGLELMSYTEKDSEVGKFIDKYGEGVFLLSLKVDNTEKALEELKAKNVPLIDEVPRKWRDSNYIFLKPKAFFGVLMEFID